MVSIVVPCYNCENTIENTVKHLQNQTESNLEIILVDDGSTDTTSYKCDDFASKDRRIKVIHQENMGLMRAWKNGVIAATGKYITFCDADDYVDEDLVERLYNVIAKHSVEMIVYGMYEEYENGDNIKSLNRLSEGYYDKKMINEEVLPTFFSDGRMQSEILSMSRCSKTISKDLLVRILDDLPDDISFSEDSLTTFAITMNTDSIYCMGEYAPYHYVRHAGSMIGKHDTEVFSKIDRVYSVFQKLAEKYDYQYNDQILQNRLSITLLFMKKEICRNPNGRKAILSVLKHVRESDEFIECVSMCSVDGYQLTSKVFAEMMIKRLFVLAYYMVKVYEMKRGRNT